MFDLLTFTGGGSKRAELQKLYEKKMIQPRQEKSFKNG